MAIDERRCFFWPNLVRDLLPGQDIKQVWFAGVHSDVGGGYPEAEEQIVDSASGMDAAGVCTGRPDCG